MSKSFDRSILATQEKQSYSSDFGSYGFIETDDFSPSLFRIFDFGYETRSNETYRFDSRNRDSYEGYLFQLTLEGEGIIDFSDTSYKLPKNSGFLINFPSDTCYYLPPGSSGYWTYFYIHFTGEGSKLFFERLQTLSDPIFNLGPSSPSIQLFFKEYQALKNGKTYKRFEASNFLYLFLTTLLTELESSPNTNRHLVESCVQWIHRNYSTDKTLTEMCQTLGVTLSHLSRQFKEEKGQSPVEYLTHVRLQHAISLLLNTELPIHKISSLCGYASSNYFSKVFFRHLNISPSDYRRKFTN